MRNILTCAGLLFLVQHCVMAQTTVAVRGPDPETPLVAAAVPIEPSFIPMTQSDRVHYYFKSTFNATSILASTAAAGIAQWQDSPTEWHQGAEGYGKRLGSIYAKHIVRQTIAFGASSVLHEDNRYIPSGRSGFGTRLKYAIVSTLLARRDDGTQRLSFSRIGSTAGAVFVSRLWQPPSANTTGHAATSFGVSMGTQIGFNVAREFLHRKTQDGRRDTL
jgi:hypothetical protein